MDGRHNDKMDLMKCVAIFSVVFLRLALPGLLRQAVNCLARFAVPLFFLSAGYFSWGKGTSALARNCRRTGVRLLLACLPALLLGCVLALRQGENVAAYLVGRLEPVDSLWVRNAWLDGFPFFALGVWMGAHREQLRRLRPEALWSGVALTVPLSLAERRLVALWTCAWAPSWLPFC